MTLSRFPNRFRILILCGIAGVLLWLGPGKPFLSEAAPSESAAMSEEKPSVSGVCPPFKLRDETGAEIDPVHGVNASAPYSPKQTCGTTGCHNYDLITEGFHFTQGKGEQLPPEYASRYNWVSFPGNYGGNWCSPSPLYRQLAPKQNTNARTIDMTSFDFVTATCGNCHPGGGPMEYDRDGHRYDEWMADPASGFTPGAENGLDGDYYKARWSQTGVIEADCLLCHMPEYDYKKRNAQLANLNFRWAATEGAGFATVSRKVIANETPEVAYNLQRFDADGNVLVHIAPEPRNETCLNCHFKPDWKKRGSAYSTRTDVHMVAGLRCVDCHAAGSRATDSRIRGREVHQFGKGDDPSGWVRNDLDDTVRSCEDCHLEGWRNAPIATHEWLPPMHMEKISCQACHIPARAVKSALVQASDVYNPAPRIAPPPKHIWTFYDQEMKFWNHYGELELFTGADEPTNVTRPTLASYKGKIYPVNRVHSAWVGYEEEGKEGLNQLFMPDFFKMWKEHVADPGKNWTRLADIRDDNRDGHLEVNKPEEIDALLAATRDYLAKTGFPLDGKRLVYVSDNHAYYTSTDRRDLEHELHEATAYASVYKFSHDVAPARAAIGVGGCVDCHGSNSSFFFAPVLDVAFSPEDGQPRWIENHSILGISPLWIRLGSWREEWLKPAIYLLSAILALLVLLALLKEAALRSGLLPGGSVRILHRVLVLLSIAGALYFAFNPGLRDYMWVRRFTLDANHTWIGVLILVAATVAAFVFASLRAAHPRNRSALPMLTLIVVVIAAAFGALMLFAGPDWMGGAFRLVYTGFDVGLAVAAALAAILVLKSSWSASDIETS